jgi:hypothetical protein
MMGTERKLVLSLIVCLPSVAAGMREDTARLAARLASLQGSELTAAEFTPLQAEYLAWLEVRVQARGTVQTINDELREARLLYAEPTTLPDDLEASHAGYLDAVRGEPLDEDVLALKLGIYTGSSCDYDLTVVLYQRKPFRRLGWLNAQEFHEHGHWLHGLAIGREDPARGRIIASAWTSSNCTSVWNGGRFRIDAVQPQGMTNVLNRDAIASDDEEVKISIENSGATFRYSGDMHDTVINNREGIARYKIENGKPIRQAPIASQFGGFIDEWLLLDDEDAARFSSSPAAHLHHELAARFKKEAFDWQHVADCPGSAREVAVRGDESEKVTVFLVAASSIAEMRMLSISDNINPMCREIDISKDLSAITSGPSH